MSRVAILVAGLMAVSAIVGGFLVEAGPQAASPAPVPAVHVAGNHLVNQAGARIRLLGIDRSGTEYMCLSSGIFYGPTGLASVKAMATWHVNAVRIPLNEDCWLGINGVNYRYSGMRYQSAIERYVELLNANGMVVILDLHWNAPGRTLATGQQEMADQSHSPAFWRSVATAFKTTPDVVFDLYNEPWGISWSCWLKGCQVSGGWRTAGMQELVDDVRDVGATQPIMIGGLNHSSDLTEWLKYEPKDPLHQLVASLHMYSGGGCSAYDCWLRVLDPLAQDVPIVTGEMGEYDCGDGFIDEYMKFADRVGISYLGWAWDAGWNCNQGPALIYSWEGEATPFGVGLRDHLAKLARHAGARA